jgi:hypothetical protein
VRRGPLERVTEHGSERRSRTCLLLVSWCEGAGAGHLNAWTRFMSRVTVVRPDGLPGGATVIPNLRVKYRSVPATVKTVPIAVRTPNTVPDSLTSNVGWPRMRGASKACTERPEPTPESRNASVAWR